MAQSFIPGFTLSHSKEICKDFLLLNKSWNRTQLDRYSTRVFYFIALKLSIHEGGMMLRYLRDRHSNKKDGKK